MSIRVLVADADEVVRVGLRTILSRERGFLIVGESGDGRDTVGLVRTTRPDVCVVGTSLTGFGGLEVVRRVAALPGTGCRAVVLTGSTADDDFRTAMGGGAHAYLHKSVTPRLLRQSIRLVAAGAYALSPAAAGSLRDLLDGPPRHAPPEPRRPLSPRERQVAAMVAVGRTDREIACSTGVSVSAVKKTVSGCRRKVRAKNRVQLARWAWQSGLEPPPPGGPSDPLVA
ncbi:response regulator [Streptomyces celluloflavus]|uniref:response regulator n=2 Tax=Streptomyces celluloflavus TaxID=58344 RepID=UPI0036A400D2